MNKISHPFNYSTLVFKNKICAKGIFHVNQAKESLTLIGCKPDE